MNGNFKHPRIHTTYQPAIISSGVEVGSESVTGPGAQGDYHDEGYTVGELSAQLESLDPATPVRVEIESEAGERWTFAVRQIVQGGDGELLLAIDD